MMLTPKRYDVVTADVIHPIFAGSGNLYSIEYFQLARHVLNRGGMVVQRVAGTEAEYKIIARTFLSVFPETTVWGDQLIGAFDGGPEELRAFVGPGPLLTDDKPVVEYFLSLPRDRDVDTSTLKGDVRRYLVEP